MRLQQFPVYDYVYNGTLNIKYKMSLCIHNEEDEKTKPKEERTIINEKQLNK